jgi:hypothetical protein
MSGMKQIQDDMPYINGSFIRMGSGRCSVAMFIRLHEDNFQEHSGLYLDVGE